jgi:HK97 gp10 family phage protein
MEVKVEIQGLTGVEDALANAGPKLAKKALRKALRAGGQIFIDQAKQRAPVLVKGTPQRRPGELRDSIKGIVKMSPKQESGRITVGPTYGKSERRDSPGLYGLFVEFGTRYMPAQPYMRPAFDQNARRALDAATEVLRAAVDDLKNP